MTKEPKTVLCVPGLWKDKATLISSLNAVDSKNYLCTEAVFQNIPTQESWTLEIENPDVRLVVAFQSAGAHWAGAEILAKINAHTFVVYLVGTGGSANKAVALMKAAGVLLHAGGLAVKVESSGIAHSRETWLRFLETLPDVSAHRAFVVYVTGEDTCSCGMHNLGLPDAVIDSRDAANPVELLSAFTRYLYLEKPSIRDGHAFSADAISPKYRLKLEPCDFYDSGSLFKNPYGMWRLISKP